MKTLALTIFLLCSAINCFCQDFLCKSEKEIKETVAVIMSNPIELNYQTPRYGSALYVDTTSTVGNGLYYPFIRDVPQKDDTLFTELGKNAEVKIDCYFRAMKPGCDSVVIHCYDEQTGNRLIEYLITDSFRLWKDMGNKEYLSLKSLGVLRGRNINNVKSAKMKIDFLNYDCVYARICISRADIARKEWKKLKTQKK